MKRKSIYFFAGVLSFGVSQLLLRIPLLSASKQTYGYLWLSVAAPLVLAWLLAFSAGLFEETGRLVMMKLSMKIAGSPKKFALSDAVVFGLGHGLLEAGWIIIQIVPYIRLYGLNSSVILSLLERTFAVIFHISMSIFVALTVNSKKMRWYLLALVLHTAVDGIIVYFTSAVLLEAVFAAIAVSALIAAVYIFSHYKEEKNDADN